ncbi:MAG: alpha-ketoacid dehydrogenase subunit beta [Chloroflexota bacterium]
MPVQTYLEAIRGALFDEMGRDARVVVLGEDVAVRGGVFGATRGLLEAYGEQRVIDTPLAEVGIAGVAIGAAANGLLPVAEMQFADYIHPAFDQIVNEASRIRYRSNGAWSCPIVIRAPFGGGVHGGLYHSQSVEAFYCHVPGVKVVAPSTPADARGLLLAAIRDPDPVLYFEHKGAYRRIKGDVPADTDALPLGRADIKRSGKHLTAICYGLMVHTCLDAAERVAAEGIEAAVLDLRTLQPLDREAILAAARQSGKILVVHEDTRSGGLAGEIAATICEAAFEYLDAPIMRVTGPDVPAMPYSTPLEAAYLPNAERVADAMRRLARY